MLTFAIFFALNIDVSSSFAQRLQVLPFHTHAVPASMKVKGKIESGLRWLDQNGDNYVLFSSIEKKSQTKSQTNTSVYLYVNHYVINKKGVNRLRLLRDKEERCEYDNMAGFIKKSFTVTDLDHDQVGEVTFVYTVDCRSGMGSDKVKLVILENGKKYIIRGTTKVGSKGEMEGGKQKIDPSFLKGPGVFLDYAKKMWVLHTVEVWPG